MNFFEQYLESVTPELFSFSYALIPDELQASQMVVDSFALLFGQCQDDLREAVEDEDYRVIKNFLYKSILIIAKKRSVQLHGALSGQEEGAGAFNRLSVSEKAVLFLKHKMDFDTFEIGEIVKAQQNEVIALVHSAQNSLLEGLGWG